MSKLLSPIRELVVRKDGEDTGLPVTQYPVCPGFTAHKRALSPQFAQKTDQDEYLSYLQRRIARNPRDLLSHAQRILMYFHRDHVDGCFGAMVDLFIAAGSNGLDLKRSLLAQVKTLLSREQFIFFLTHLRQGISPSALLAAPANCILAQGIEGTTDVVMRIGANDDGASLLEQAYEYLRDARIEESRACLEQALYNDPGDTLVCMELLAIYQEYHLRDAFYKTYTEFSARKLALPELWHKLDSHFYDSRHPG